MSRTILVFVLFLLAPGLAPAQTYRLVDGNDEMRGILASREFDLAPGYAMLVGTSDAILITHASGLRDLESGAPIETDTPFYIASVGKTFTSWAILKLYEDKRLRLESRLSDYFPSFPPFADEITIHHMLNHTSGLPDYYDAEDADRILNNQDVVAFVAGADSLQFDPGVDYAYSNTAYVLLAEIVEKVTGQSYSEYIESTFLVPLGMTKTIVVDEPGDIPSDRAIGYSMEEAEWTVDDYAGRTTTGAGGMYSTIHDLYRWYQAMESHRFIGARSTAMAQTAHYTLSGRRSFMMMGWFEENFGPRTPEVAGMRVTGAIGVLNGFRTNMHFMPEHGLVYIYLGNGGDFHVSVQDVAAAYLKREQ